MERLGGIRRTWTRRATALVVSTIVLGLLAGIAFATIPSSGGVISACYATKTGALRVIDSEGGKRCSAGERPLDWNQIGPQGPAGPEGPPGSSSAFATPTGELTTVPGSSVVLTELRVPAGSYVIQGAVRLVNTDPSHHAIAQCFIPGASDSALGLVNLEPDDFTSSDPANSGNNANAGMITLVYADRFFEPFTVRLMCNNNGFDFGGLQADNFHLVATQVGTLYGSRWASPPSQ